MGRGITLRYRGARGLLTGLAGVVCTLVCMAGATLAQAGVNSWTSTGAEGGGITALGFHPTRNGVVFAVSARVYRSTDSGAHWTAVSENGPITGNFVFDPSNPDRILVSGQPVLRSTDGGASFFPATPMPDQNFVARLAITNNGSAVYAASAGRVFRSTDFAQSWTEISNGLPGSLAGGPGGLSISPSDPNTLYVSSSTAGLFKTTDGGANWTHVASLAGGVSGIAINPNNASQLLAWSSSSTQLFRSNDAGASWSSVAFGYITWFEFDPLVPNRVVGFDNLTRRLIVSTDAGGAWLPAAQVPTAQGGSSGSLSSTTAGLMAFGTTEGVYASTDGGQTLAFRATGMNATDLRAIAVSRSAPYRVYGSFYSGPIGVHLRGAGNWQVTNADQLFTAMASRIVIESLAVDPNDPTVVYAGGYGGVAKSTNAGNTWSRIWTTAASNIAYTIAVDPADTRVLYVASTEEGVMRSPDGGVTWAARNNGLPVVGGKVAVVRVFVDPADSQHLYSMPQQTGNLYRSVDAGQNWTKMSGGLPADETGYALAFDPLQPNCVYIGGQAGVYRSLDGGVTWSRLTVPLGGFSFLSVFTDPSASGSVVAIAGSGSPGIFRSLDFGVTWERLPWVSGSSTFGSWPAKGVWDPAQPGNLIVGGNQVGVREFQIAPDLTLSLSGLAGQVALGSTPTLRLTAQNKVSSQFAASDATVTLSLPAVLVPGTVTTTRGSCTRTGQTVSCRLGALKTGETAQIDVPLTTTAGGGNVIASVQPREIDASIADNSVTLPLSVLPSSDLRTTMTLPTFMDVGGSGTLNAELRNLGPHGAANAKLTVTLPAGFTLSGIAPSPCTLDASTLSCQVANLAVGGTASIAMPFTVGASGVLNVSAAGTSSSLDVDATNSTATATINVVAPTTGGDSGSGGGAVGLWTLLAMLGWAFRSSLRRQMS
jgi:uncharacterized repeat protein (TIGR01451 family)